MLEVMYLLITLIKGASKGVMHGNGIGA